MESLMPLITQLITGIAGGNIIGIALRQASTNILVRTLAGATGGIGGGLLLNLVGGETGIAGISFNAIAGFVGGLALAAAIGAVLGRK